jgi:peptide chain release factor 1
MLQDEVNRLKTEIKKNQTLLLDPELKKLAQKEIDRLKTQLKTLEKTSVSHSWNTPQVKLRSSNDDQNFNNRPVIIEIRAAAGGDEAKIWANDLLRMYTRFADSLNLKVKTIDNLIIQIKPNRQISNLYSFLQFEAGVHRVQRIPTTETHGRIHTSTASVAVLPSISSTEINIKEEDLDWQFIRAGGHGGQNVNKVSSAVRLTHKPSNLVISVRQERSQQQNRAIALQLLRNQLWEIEEAKKQRSLEQKRQSAVGRGMRSEKIRTYNYPQNRVTDHRLNQSWHNLDKILNGNIKPIVDALKSHYL